MEDHHNTMQMIRRKLSRSEWSGAMAHKKNVNIIENSWNSLFSNKSNYSTILFLPSAAVRSSSKRELLTQFRSKAESNGCIPGNIIGNKRKEYSLPPNLCGLEWAFPWFESIDIGPIILPKKVFDKSQRHITWKAASKGIMGMVSQNSNKLFENNWISAIRTWPEWGVWVMHREEYWIHVGHQPATAEDEIWQKNEWCGVPFITHPHRSPTSSSTTGNHTQPNFANWIWIISNIHPHTFAELFLTSCGNFQSTAIYDPELAFMGCQL